MATKKKPAKKKPAKGPRLCCHSDAGLCPSTGGEHMPDWDTVTPAQGMPAVVDVSCLHCGRSGSITLKIEDVLW